MTNPSKKRGRKVLAPSPTLSDIMASKYSVPGYFIEEGMLGEDAAQEWRGEDAWEAYSRKSFRRSEELPAETQYANILLALDDRDGNKVELCKKVIHSQFDFMRLPLKWRYCFTEKQKPNSNPNKNKNKRHYRRAEPWVIRHMYEIKEMEDGRKMGIISETYVYDDTGRRFFAVDYDKHGPASDVHGHRWMSDDGHGPEHFIGEAIPWFWMAIPLEIPYPDGVEEFRMALNLNDCAYENIELPECEEIVLNVVAGEVGEEESEEELSETEDPHKSKRSRANEDALLPSEIPPSSPPSHITSHYSTSPLDGMISNQQASASSSVVRSMLFRPVAKPDVDEQSSNTKDFRR